MCDLKIQHFKAPIFLHKKTNSNMFSCAALRFKPISLLPPKRRTRRSRGRSVAKHALLIRNKVEWVLGKVLHLLPFCVCCWGIREKHQAHHARVLSLSLSLSLSRLLIKRASHFCACTLFFVFLSKLVRFVSSLVAFIRAALLSSFFCKC